MAQSERPPDYQIPKGMQAINVQDADGNQYVPVPPDHTVVTLSAEDRAVARDMLEWGRHGGPKDEALLRRIADGGDDGGK